MPKTGGVKAGPERCLMMPPKLRKVPATTVQNPHAHPNPNPNPTLILTLSAAPTYS